MALKACAAAAVLLLARAGSAETCKLATYPEKPSDEGKIQAGHGRQVANMLLDGGSGIGAKGLTDELSGAVFKPWMMIPITTVTLAFFSNGGDVLLKPGYKIEIDKRGE